MSETKHTPGQTFLPIACQGGLGGMQTRDGKVLGTLLPDGHGVDIDEIHRRREFVVRACNAHDDLLAACEEMLVPLTSIFDVAGDDIANTNNRALLARWQAEIAKAKP